MRVIYGNLLDLALDGVFDVIVHGCNCFCTFGAGIAWQIADRFPEAYLRDKRTIKGSRRKLGSYTSTNIVRGDSNFVIVNAYTQYNYGNHAPNANYVAIDEVFRKIAINFNGKRIGYPLIGAGLARGDWYIISPIIDRNLKEQDHALVLLKSPEMISHDH
jgi:O-acetyl-ADP-ribose deacetylase (regulator of RNase III)